MVTSDLVEIIKASGALQFGKFILASGRESGYYVDIKRAITSPNILRELAERMVPYAAGSDRIAGIELGAVPLAVALSLRTSLPYIIVRKDVKAHGTKGVFEGALNRGERVLFVEDVTTTANTLRSGIQKVRDQGGVVERAICVVDREEGAEENLRQIGIELIPLLKIRDLLKGSPLERK